MKNTDIHFKVERWGRFHFAEVTEKETGITAIGISRKSDADSIDDELGVNIAKGRAKKALMKKNK